ncbi:Glutathione S-transferase Z1 [Capsicum baccatum]|uniref:Glutathione S-transferase Z1 n=1 Tax=Capsicum baccatum TaxID=33114 RepID=A0A2G2WPL8_CAPBA|nr:Glutathione S-transferase Z1 [Capsicum baccatum]
MAIGLVDSPEGFLDGLQRLVRGSGVMAAALTGGEDGDVECEGWRDEERGVGSMSDWLSLLAAAGSGEESKKLKLYSYWRSSCAFRVRKPLNLKGSVVIEKLSLDYVESLFSRVPPVH